MIPTSSTAALPPQPFPFFSATGAWGGGFAPGLGFGAALAAAGLAAGPALAGAAGLAGAGAGVGLGGAGAGVGVGFAGDLPVAPCMVMTSITRVPLPFATPLPSSVGSNTVATSPNRTFAP